jgi:protein-cysteine N-palmitoyltransferase HHAT
MLLIAHPILRRVYDFFSTSHLYTSVPNKPQRSGGLTQGLSQSAAADARLEQRVSFDFYFAIVFIIALHGFSSAKMFLILYINYKLSKNLPKHMVPVTTWIFNIGILFANEFCRGYPYSSVSRILSFGFPEWGVWLDSHGGLISRWEVTFNVTILRLISFNMDYYWSLNSGASSPIEVG